MSYDAVVIGCGPAGSSTATHLAKHGLSVLALDKAPFPRYHIGESLTGTVADYLRDLGLEQAMGEHQFPVKYGVSVVGREARNEFFVATAPEPAWQVVRSRFDRTLLENAVENGVEHRVGTVLDVTRDGDRVTGIRYRDPEGDTVEAAAPCVVDASGANTVLSKLCVAGPRIADDFGDQIAIFSQIADCDRDPGLMAGNTVIFYSENHHWAWMIPLDERVASVGVVVPREIYLEQLAAAREHGEEATRAIFDWGLTVINPELERRCGGRELTETVRVIRDYSYAIEPYAGPGWLCVGDAHRFVDPIFSFGVAIAFHEAEMAADAITGALNGGDSTALFNEYQRRCNIGQCAVSDVIRYFWRFPAFFGVQARGPFREDIMKLFAGACYDEKPIPGLVMMRESLAKA